MAFSLSLMPAKMLPVNSLTQRLMKTMEKFEVDVSCDLGASPRTECQYKHKLKEKVI